MIHGAGCCKLSIPQDFQHALGCLFFGIYPIDQFTILIMAHNDMLGRRNKAMLDSTIATDLVLVRAFMKKSNIQRFSIGKLWKKHFINMLFRIIVIMAVAGNTAQGYPLVFLLPFIYWQHQELFSNAPGIGQS